MQYLYKKYKMLSLSKCIILAYLLVSLLSCQAPLQDRRSYSNPYILRDEYKKSNSIKLVINYLSLNADDETSNNEIQRSPKITFYNSKDTLIGDLLDVKLELNLTYNERRIQDSMYFKVSKYNEINELISSVKIKNQAYFYQSYEEQKFHTVNKSESVTVTIPSRTETVVDSKGERHTIDIPASTNTQNISVPVSNSDTRLFNIIHNKIDFQLSKEDLKLISTCSNLEFRIYTDNGGIRLNFPYSKLNKLKDFIASCSSK
ncbi:MAG: hypothetical protein IPL42_02220 [Saprospiraceae bacterium]|nr:hypothetical protein [Saprospiraceae bacterium]